MALFIWGVIWFALTSIVGWLMYASQVDPDQAVSNLFKWAKKIGIEDPPQWLRDKSADRKMRRNATIALAVLLVAGGAIGGIAVRDYFWPTALGVTFRGADAPMLRTDTAPGSLMAKTQKATSLAPPAASAAMPPTVTTAPADVPKKLAAIDNLRQILNDEMAPWINKGMQLTSAAWQTWTAGGETSHLRDETQNFYQVGRELNDKFQKLQKDYAQFPDIVALSSPPFDYAYNIKMEKFITPVLAMHDDTRQALGNDLFRFLYEPPAKEADEAIIAVENWRKTTDKNALQLRRQISQ